MRLLVHVGDIVRRLRFFSHLRVLVAHFTAGITFEEMVFIQDILIDDDVLDRLIELLVLNATEFDKRGNIQPNVFVFLLVLAIALCQLIDDLFCDVRRDLKKEDILL